MPLNKRAGNMYSFITHTWNPIRGRCPIGCSYCYMNRFPLKEVALHEEELQTDLGVDKTIFIGSSIDMFADTIPDEWILKVLETTKKFPGNQYFYQTKNPYRLTDYLQHIDPHNSLLCITLESNKPLLSFRGKADTPTIRALDFSDIPDSYQKYITIEPIMSFDLDSFVKLIRLCHPIQVNIGADSKGNHLPEPSTKEVNELINELKQFTKVVLKDNLRRIKKGE